MRESNSATLFSCSARVDTVELGTGRSWFRPKVPSAGASNRPLLRHASEIWVVETDLSALLVVVRLFNGGGMGRLFAIVSTQCLTCNAEQVKARGRTVTH